MGAIIVLVMTNGLIRLGYGTGTNQMVLGLMLAAAVILDIRWLKNRHKVLERGLCRAGLSSAWARRSRPLPGSGSALRARQPAVRGRAVSGSASSKGRRMSSSTRDDHLYCGTRHGEIVRFFAPDYTRSEVFAHTGGFPLGLAFDRDGNLISLRRRHGALFDRAGRAR